MSYFKNQLAALDLDDGRRRKLLEPLVYVVGNKLEITVPADFVTDGASTPRFLWFWFPPYDKGSRAAVLHDYLYSDVIDGSITRAVADAIFLDAMTALGVSKLKRRVMYLAVRAFGGLHILLNGNK